MIFTPKSGTTDANNGKTAQWIAQATEAVIPSASQFNLKDIERAKLGKSNYVAKSINSGALTVLFGLAVVNLHFK